MGWTSTSDPIEHVSRASLLFYTKEEAIRFCEKHGWAYTVEDPNIRRPDRQKRFGGYGENFRCAGVTGSYIICGDYIRALVVV